MPQNKIILYISEHSVNVDNERIQGLYTSGSNSSCVFNPFSFLKSKYSFYRWNNPHLPCLKLRIMKTSS